MSRKLLLANRYVLSWYGRVLARAGTMMDLYQRVREEVHHGRTIRVYDQLREVVLEHKDVLEVLKLKDE